MLDFSFAEIALIVVVALIFIGPKELPLVVRAAAKAMRAMRGLTGEMRKAFDDLAQESGLKDVAGDFHREMRMIKGDDGKLYESYTIPSPLEGDGKRGAITDENENAPTPHLPLTGEKEI